MMNRERRREFLNIFSSLLLAWDHFAIRVCCRTILLWFIHFILVFPQQWIVVVVVALSPDQTERSSSFFSPAKLFLPAEEVWSNVIVSERGKVRGNMKGATFLFMEVQEFIQWESLSRQPAEKRRVKKRDNIEAESLAEWWKMRESWTEKSLLELFLCSASVLAVVFYVCLTRLLATSVDPCVWNSNSFLVRSIWMRHFMVNIFDGIPTWWWCISKTHSHREKLSQIINFLWSFRFDSWRHNDDACLSWKFIHAQILAWNLMEIGNRRQTFSKSSLPLLKFEGFCWE